MKQKISDIKTAEAVVKLAEIDGNLIRKDLHYIDECDQIAERKELYLALHPETAQDMRNGQAPKAEPGAVLDTQPFDEDTARKTGVTSRTIRQSVQISEALTDESKQAAKALSLRKKEAVALARMSEEEQREAIKKRAGGEIKDIRELAKPKRVTKYKPVPEASWTPPECSNIYKSKVYAGTRLSDNTPEQRALIKQTCEESNARNAVTAAEMEARYTVDDLVKEIKLECNQITGRIRTIFSMHSFMLSNPEYKLKIMTALSQAEAAIRQLKGLIQ